MIHNSEPLTLFSPLPFDAAVERLEEAVDIERNSLFFPNRRGTKNIVGSIKGDRIQLRKRNWYQNSFQSYLRATLSPETAGTRISGSIGILPFVRGFMVIWLAGVILMSLSMLVIAIVTHEPTAALLSFIPLIVMPAFGFAIVAFCRHLARDESAFLIHFLIKTLEAQDDSPTPAAS